MLFPCLVQLRRCDKNTHRPLVTAVRDANTALGLGYLCEFRPELMGEKGNSHHISTGTEPEDVYTWTAFLYGTLCFRYSSKTMSNLHVA